MGIAGAYEQSRKLQELLRMKIILPNERPMSWNIFYSGKHWRTRHEEALRVHGLVKYSTLNKTRLKRPCNITITAYFDKSPLDADNINCKLYIDGLKEKVIVDDNPKWVDSITAKSRVDKDNPRVEILIEEI